MSVKQLYLRGGDKVRGPYPVSQVSEAARQGKLLPSHEGSADGQTWFKLETIWTRLVGEREGEPPASAAAPGVPQQKASPPPPRPATAPAAPAAPDEPMFLESAAPAPAKRRQVSDSLDREKSPRVKASSRASADSGTADPDTGWVDSAPAYQPNFYLALRMVLLFSAIFFAVIGIDSALAILVLKFKMTGGFAQLVMMTPMLAGRILGTAAFILDVVGCILLIVWLHNVWARLRAMNDMLGREKFSQWAVNYFVPIWTAISTATLMTRVWNASSAGRSRRSTDKTTPDVVSAGMVLRLIAWVGYIASSIGGLYLLSKLSGGRRIAGAEADAIGNLVIVTLAALAVYGLAATAVVWTTFQYASTVHRKMTVLDDSSDSP